MDDLIKREDALKALVDTDEIKGYVFVEMKEAIETIPAVKERMNKMPYDKKLHLIAGTLIALIMGIIIDPVTGIGLAIVAGIGKECYDDYRYGGFDWQDMLTTWVGGCVGFAVLSLCKYWFG